MPPNEKCLVYKEQIYIFSVKSKPAKIIHVCSLEIVDTNSNCGINNYNSIKNCVINSMDFQEMSCKKSKEYINLA